MLQHKSTNNASRGGLGPLFCKKNYAKMSIFLVKIRGGWGLCPQTHIASGGWGLRLHTSGWSIPFVEYERHWKKAMKFCSSRNFGLATPLDAKLCHVARHFSEWEAIVRGFVEQPIKSKILRVELCGKYFH